MTSKRAETVLLKTLNIYDLNILNSSGRTTLVCNPRVQSVVVTLESCQHSGLLCASCYLSLLGDDASLCTLVTQTTIVRQVANSIQPVPQSQKLNLILYQYQFSINTYILILRFCIHIVHCIHKKHNLFYKRINIFKP